MDAFLLCVLTTLACEMKLKVEVAEPHKLHFKPLLASVIPKPGILQLGQQNLSFLPVFSCVLNYSHSARIVHGTHICFNIKVVKLFK
jgi:hypothetical protein